MIYQIKALGKLYSNMPIKCLFDPLFDHQQPKITEKIAIFVDCYTEGGTSTPNIRKQKSENNKSLTVSKTLFDYFGQSY